MQSPYTPNFLFFYTPPFRELAFFGHIVEHCMLSPFLDSPEPYFDGKQGVELHFSHNHYIKIEIPYYMDREDVLERCKQPLKNKIITREIKALREELADGRDREELLADQIAKYVGKPVHSTKIPKVAYEEIRVYHQKYIQEGYWILCDRDNGILATNLTKKYAGTTVPDPSTYLYQEFRPHGYKYLTVIVPTENPYDALFAEFVDRLISYREVYQYRYQKGQYYYREYDSSYITGYSYIGLSHLLKYDFGEAFFDAAQKYFIEKERQIGGRYALRVWELMHQQLLNEDQIKEYMKFIAYEDVHHVIQKVIFCERKNKKKGLIHLT